MTIIKPTDGYKALAEQVIKWAIRDLEGDEEDVYMSHNRYTACTFFLSEKKFDFWTGLAPHMIRDWERCIPIAERILLLHYPNGDPNKRRKI